MDISISLTPDLHELIKSKVESSRYSSTSEVVHEALRLLERADRLDADRVAALRHAWQDGIESGNAGALGFTRMRDMAQQTLSAFKR